MSQEVMNENTAVNMGGYQQHGVQMRLQTVVRAGFNRDPNTLRVALLRERNSFLNTVGGVARQRIVQIPNEVVPVWSPH